MKITMSVDIDAPLDHVFDLVDDPEKTKLWMESLEDTFFLTERNPENPVGSRFSRRIRESGRVVEYEGEVTGYTYPTYLAFNIGNKDFTMAVSYRFSPADPGTRLDFECDTAMHSTVARIMETMFGWMTKSIIRKQITKLKEVAERLA
ncbi:MAG: SRPBCC family protein [Candidatus Hydrogenedentes bacterium]|nr:SRPBCC family protein [Candidatus Hydrogenedentota bacterium]